MKEKLIKIIMLALLMFMMNKASFAMKICANISLKERFDNADVVFVGKVVKVVSGKDVPVIEEEITNGGNMVTFPDNYWDQDKGQNHFLEVQKVYKGDLSEMVQIYSSEVYMSQNDELLLFAHLDNGRLEVGGCNEAIILGNATQELKELENFSER